MLSVNERTNDTNLDEINAFPLDGRRMDCHKRDDIGKEPGIRDSNGSIRYQKKYLEHLGLSKRQNPSTFLPLRYKPMERKSHGHPVKLRDGFNTHT
jgi:hypothetical protein